MAILKLDAAISELVALLRTRRLIPFVGAGYSAFWHLPGWDGLVSELAAILDGARPSSISEDDLLSIPSRFERVRGRGELALRLRDLLGTSAIASLLDSIIHTALLELPLDTIYTTNFDDLLERSHEAAGIPFRSITTFDDLASAVPDRRFIYRFHGDHREPSSLTVTEEDYQKRVWLTDPRDVRLLSDAIGKRLLFLGYSFRDFNVKNIWTRLKTFGLDRIGGARSFVVLVDPSASQAERLETFGLDVIPLEKTSDFAPLEEFMSQLVEKTIRAFHGYQIDNLFKRSTPIPIFTGIRRRSIEGIVRDGSISSQERAHTLRLAIEGTRLLPDDSGKTVAFIDSVLIDSGLPLEIRTALLFALPHFHGGLLCFLAAKSLFEGVRTNNQELLEASYRCLLHCCVYDVVASTSAVDEMQKVRNNVACLLLAGLLEEARADRQWFKRPGAGRVESLLGQFSDCPVMQKGDAEGDHWRIELGKLQPGFGSTAGRPLLSGLGRGYRQIFIDMMKGLPASVDE
jgi:hypothetical protein